MKDQRPIIIKKVKKGGHGHHGGAWKIAYADFVTAMMAFFLLMWLINATTEEQKLGIANYFDPISVGSQNGGSKGVMGGTSVRSKQSTLDSSSSPSSIKPMSMKQKGAGGEKTDSSKYDGNSQNPNKPMETPKESDVNEAQSTSLEEEIDHEKDEQLKAQQEAEERKLKAIKNEIEEALKKDEELQELAKNIIIEETKEGLRIQLVDQDNQSMFPSGSSRMYSTTQKLLKQVADVIKQVPNRLSISGHTDAAPYTNTKNYGNWELSTDRANASRLEIVNNGVEEERFTEVIGKEAKEPLITDNPFSAQNRRISITLIRSVAKPSILPPLPQIHEAQKSKKTPIK